MSKDKPKNERLSLNKNRHHVKHWEILEKTLECLHTQCDLAQKRMEMQVLYIRWMEATRQRWKTKMTQ